MKVKELIDILQRTNQEKIVMVDIGETFMPLEEVNFENSNLIILKPMED